MSNLKLAALLAIAATLGCSDSHGQADPYWLRSWNEAQRSRPAQMSASSTIASMGEPGTTFVVRGQIFLPDGRTPASRVVVHAYHRDHAGYDFGANDTALTTWRLQGWALTDGDGRFAFRTIRPAPDHLGREGAHVHFTLESRFGRQWWPTVYLADDPLVRDRMRRDSAAAGEFGWVREVTTSAGVQYMDLKLRLKEKADF